MGKVGYKFKPGSFVWVMIDNEPCELTVEKIKICVTLNYDGDVVIFKTYSCSRGHLGGKYGEADLYGSKEELKQAIFG